MCKTVGEALIYTQKEHGRWKDFFQGGGQQWVFPGGGQTHFSRGGPTVAKFHYTISKVGDKHFSTKKLIGKYQIQNPWGACCHAFSFVDVL